MGPTTTMAGGFLSSGMWMECGFSGNSLERKGVKGTNSLADIALIKASPGCYTRSCPDLTMQKSGDQSPVVRFGLFEVDLHTGEIRKGGRKINLQEQPFQILAMLLERPGELVTREELQEK